MTENAYEPTQGQVLLARDECEFLRTDLNWASPLIEGSEARARHLASARSRLERIAELLGCHVSVKELEDA